MPEVYLQQRKSVPVRTPNQFQMNTIGHMTGRGMMMTNKDSQFTSDYRAWGQQLTGRESDGFVSLDTIGPDFTIPTSAGRSSSAPDQPQGSDVHPPLFDKTKSKGGLGPVYVVPSFPTQPGFLPSTSGGQGMPLVEQEHPPLFGQDQEHGGFGPIYAVPTFPFPHGHHPQTQTMPHPSWQRSQNQDTWGNHWQHGGYFLPIYCPFRCVRSPFYWQGH